MDWRKISAGLSAEFPREAIHWRAQTLTKAGDKALALAYLDARDVMERLDEVAGPENWSDSYTETPKGRLICTLSIRCNDEWIAKSDGAGETDVEGEKGAISAALKRAAVKWGIGRYLYDLPDVWAPCETGPNGKWKAWKGSPWACVRAPAQRTVTHRPDGSQLNADFAGEPEPKAPQHDRDQQTRTLIGGACSLPALEIAKGQVREMWGGKVQRWVADAFAERERQIREQDAKEMTA